MLRFRSTEAFRNNACYSGESHMVKLGVGMQVRLAAT
jgi:hypothetical protein